MNAEFFHHLHDTIILLGGGTRIASMVERFDTLTEADTNELRGFNAKLVTMAKDKLSSIHRTKILVGDDLPSAGQESISGD